MENAADALKMAFAILIFVLALSITIIKFGQLNDVSKVVLASSDKTNYYEYETFDEKSRTVGLESVIPTLYKYYRENYTVLFLDKNGKALPLYQTQTNVDLWGGGRNTDGYTSATGTIGKYYVPLISRTQVNLDREDRKGFVCSFDVEEETLRHEPWTGKTSDFKRNLDAFLKGGEFLYPSGATDVAGNPLKYQYKNGFNNNKGFIKKYEKAEFKEVLGEYFYTVEGTTEEYNAGLQKNRKKRIIIYQLLNE